ncbi:MAG: hypothetical protein AAF382_16935 [Pseudomonadota bacterium]
MHTLSRRQVLTLTLASATVPLAVSAQAGTFPNGSDRDPADKLPRWYSVNRFLRLSEDQVYDVARAVRLGRAITIEGYSRSESRKIIQLANEDLAAAHALLKK